MPDPVPPPSEWQTWKPAINFLLVMQQGHFVRELRFHKNVFTSGAANTGIIPCRQSQDSASLRTTSSTESINLSSLCIMALCPVVSCPSLRESRRPWLGAKQLGYGCASFSTVKRQLAGFNICTCPKMKLSGRKTWP